MSMNIYTNPFLNCRMVDRARIILDVEAELSDGEKAQHFPTWLHVLTEKGKA